MSASREKRTRQDLTSQGPSEKTLQKQSEDKKSRSRTILYTIVGVVVAVAVIALLVWNSSFLKNRTAAVTINGETYTAADVQYYYNSSRQMEYLYAMYGMSTYDYSTDAKDQYYDELNGVTWHDHFLEEAVDSLTQDVALAAEADKEGYTISADAQSQVDSALSSLESSWITSGYGNRASYLRAVYGSGMTYNKYVSLLNRSALASDYSSAKQESFTYDDDTLNAYYTENQDQLDTFVISQFVFQASVPTETDADGNTVELTEEEQEAALTESKAENEALAQELLARLQDGEDPAQLQEEYADDLYSYYVEDARFGSSVNTNYSDWAFDSSRKAGDTTLVEYEGGSSTSYNYCVVLFGGRYQDNDATANVRHVLISAGSDPTEDEYAEAKTQAEELLAQWQADGATEDAFAQLAVDNSADSSSASSGGLLNVTNYSSYVDTFKDWSLDPSRQSGDTAIVQNTGSSVKGYHIMYFVGWDIPAWQQTAESALRSDDVSAWEEEVLGAYTADEGRGLNYVG